MAERSAGELPEIYVLVDDKPEKKNQTCVAGERAGWE